MTVPVPVPLDQPGDPAALADLGSAVTGAAFRTGVLAAHLAGPAASAPGWLGADAAAAAEQVAAVTALVRDLHGSLTTAADRLAVHAAVLDDVRGRISALRRAQEDDFAALSARGVAPADPDALVPAVEELLAAEAARRCEHAALLAELDADAAATAGTLSLAVTGLGGTGSPGQEARVRVHLAAVLPGWGDGELGARGWSAAAGLGGPVTAAEIDGIAREGLPYAARPAYAGALLANLGVDGVRHLLVVLGRERSPSPELARFLATALGAARAPESGAGPLADVLAAGYVDPDDPDGVPDQVAAGIGALLTAVPAAAGGVRAETAAGWGEQILVRERRQGVSAADRLGLLGADLVELAVQRVADSGDPAAGAVLLRGREAWDALLARRWTDDGRALATVVEAAGAEPGPAGDAAVRAGLAALGNGLSPEGSGTWTVDRDTAALIAPALGSAVAAHAGAVAGLLGAAGAGDPLALPDDEVLRGLGHLTVDPEAAAAVQSALDARTTTAPSDAVAARGALVAVREYGQRLDHALDGFAAMSQAVDRRFTYDVTVRLTAWGFDQVVGRTPPGELASAVVDAGVDGLAALVDADGSWELPPDDGLVFDREDAAAAAAVLAPADDPVAADELGRQARAAFDRAIRALGVPQPPSPEGDVRDLLHEDDQMDLRLPYLEHTPHGPR
ncbi:hypothetical protein [Geodermatophilus sp. URMC 64]